MYKKEGCAFCAIGSEVVTADKPRRIIREEELITSFLSRPWLTKGHALVVPNRHVEDPRELTDAEVLAIKREADRLQTRMLGYVASGVDRWQKYRPLVPEAADGKQNHLHEHVLPAQPHTRLYDDGIIWGKDGRWEQPSVLEVTTLVDLLRHNVPSEHPYFT